ncbi:hypothetical protein IWX90DRAFT_140666 [Phyllosticta citrichinensis]|uniref:Uncharacterized protein n=1 Tax=Phyllosticta citrichinensis TaxID=1130410 RepID=A0ABR1XYS9_9PEZI
MVLQLRSRQRLDREAKARMLRRNWFPVLAAVVAMLLKTSIGSIGPALWLTRHSNFGAEESPEWQQSRGRAASLAGFSACSHGARRIYRRGLLVRIGPAGLPSLERLGAWPGSHHVVSPVLLGSRVRRPTPIYSVFGIAMAVLSTRGLCWYELVAQIIPRLQLQLGLLSHFPRGCAPVLYLSRGSELKVYPAMFPLY